MHAFSTAWLAAAAVSFFCERLSVTPAGWPASMVLAAGTVLLPDLLNRMLIPILFRPDVTIVTDPAERDAQVVARGIRQAMHVCLTEGRIIRVLISRVPGSIMTIGLNAVRQRVFVTLASEVDGTGELKSQSGLPPFLPGEVATWYRLTGGGDNVRLCFRPAEGAQDTIACETQTVGWRTVGIAGLALVGIVWACAGAWVAGVAVFPFVVIRTLACRHGTTGRGMLMRPMFVILGSFAVIVFNLIRMEMF